MLKHKDQYLPAGERVVFLLLAAISVCAVLIITLPYFIVHIVCSERRKVTFRKIHMIYIQMLDHKELCVALSTLSE